MWQEHFFIFTLSSKERGIAWQLDIIIIIFCLPSCCFSLEYANHEEELAFWRMLQHITKICWLQSWPTNLIFWRMQMKEKSRQKTLLFSNFLRCDLQNFFTFIFRAYFLEINCIRRKSRVMTKKFFICQILTQIKFWVWSPFQSSIEKWHNHPYSPFGFFPEFLRRRRVMLPKLI